MLCSKCQCEIVREAGARNSKSDQAVIQTIHDHSMALGATCGGGAEEVGEAAVPSEGAVVRESALQIEMEPLRESAGRSDYEIKLISPGPGAMAYYSADMLKRDGPTAFPRETKVYLNHPPIEFKELGNRDVKRLAGVLTENATWRDTHPKGPGLYSRVKVFADHADLMNEKAKYLGMSISAGGKWAMENGKQVMREGRRVLERLDASQFNSVDVVPLPGAGGAIITEAAVPAEIQPKEATDSMTEAEAKVLIEAAVSAATAPLRERALRGDAREEATRLLESVALPAAAKSKIIERAIKTVPATATGEFDAAKFRETVVSEAKAEGEYLAALGTGGRVFGMGVAMPQPVALKPEERAAREADIKREDEDAVKIFESLGMSPTAAAAAAKGRAA